MIAEWLVYGLVVSALVSVAAWLAERGARAQRWPARWVWATALVLSPVVPLLAWLRPVPPSPEPASGVVPVVSLGALTAMSGPVTVPASPSWSTLLAGGWLVASLLLLVGVLTLASRLWLRRRGWRTAEVDGVQVLVSRGVGPAALGLIRGRVVVPEWALRLPAAKRRLLVLHEAEHVRARDPQLSFLALLACVATPWNLPMWWQLRRLRLAVEVDCDARVLRRTGDRRGYGALLLEVGRHRARLALALAEPRSMLERRLRMITKATTGRATLRAAGLAALSGLVMAVACETPGPTGPAAVEREPAEAESLAAGVEEMDCEPLIYLNARPATREALDRLPPDGVDRVHVFKGEGAREAVGAAPSCGVVVVLTKDAAPAEAEAGRRLVERLVEATTADGESAPGPSLEEVASKPTFTPMTVAPSLKNPGEVQAALAELYPPLLKDAGIGGVVNVWFLIDREGAVRQTRLNAPSEHEALNQAALAVAERMEFTPAYNREHRVPVWIALDIRFEPAGAGSVPGPGDEPLSEEERLSLQDPAELPDARSVPPPAPSTPDEPFPGEPAPAEPSPGEPAPGEPAPAEPAPAEPAPPEPAPGEPAPGAAPDPTQGPTFTPMTRAPRLRNNGDVAAELERLYPPLLKDAGVEGTTNVWLLIDETGEVVQTQLNKSSGRDALDAAALRVARGMRFEPALNGDEAVTVWVALDITFALD